MAILLHSSLQTGKVKGYVFIYIKVYSTPQASPVTLMVKNLPASDGEMGSIPGSGRFLEGDHGNPFQYDCLENPMDRGAWWATVHSVAKSQTQVKQFSMHPCLVSHST